MLAAINTNEPLCLTQAMACVQKLRLNRIHIPRFVGNTFTNNSLGLVWSQPDLADPESVPACEGSVCTQRKEHSTYNENLMLTRAGWLVLDDEGKQPVNLCEFNT